VIRGHALQQQSGSGNHSEQKEDNRDMVWSKFGDRMAVGNGTDTLELRVSRRRFCR
jgi:hypothetical protein